MSREAEASLKPCDADWLDAAAAQKRLAAGEIASSSAAQLHAEADGLEAMARRLRDPATYAAPDLRRGCGGEIAPRLGPDTPAGLRDMVEAVRQTPDMLAANATLARLGLARDGDVLAMAVELAQDGTAAEKMLAHELAAAHRLAMGLFTTAAGELQKHQLCGQFNTGALAEATRSANAAARLLAAFGQGALALDRLRHGNRQVVTVQHVTVADGGRAVVAGSVATMAKQARC